MAPPVIHPVMEDMKKLGCNSQSMLCLALQVYMELSEVRRCWDVQYKFSPELGLIYFKVLDHKSQQTPELIIPMSTSQEVSPAWLSQILTTLAQDLNKKVITIALKDSDSTVLFYKVHEGLQEPMSAEESQAAKLAEEKKRLMDADLRKQQDQLYEIAKNESLLSVDK